ncbi:MAG: transposase [Methanobrevibacter sp.]|nr:transposase [Candidatus Methanovirga basalitermitum]
MKENLNYRQTNLRGKEKVQSEVNLISLAYNLKLMYNSSSFVFSSNLGEINC